MKRKRKAVRAAARRRKERSGVALVEFAIVANIAFLMIMACLEFARMNTIRNLVQDAAYFAARHVIVPGATDEEAVEVAEDILGQVVTDGYTVNVSALDFDSEQVTVTVSVDYDQVGFFSPMFVPNGTQIESTATMLTERYTGFYEQ